MTPRATALKIWQAGVDAVGGYAATQSAIQKLDAPDQILAVGKAAASMAQAALHHFGQRPCLVVTKDGHGNALSQDADLIETAHPVPDERSLRAGAALRETVMSQANGARLLVLVSGGASSLAEDLMPGVSLTDLTTLNAQLLASGQDITEMNAQRRKLSRIKSGGLLGFFPGAHVDVLAISDVPGDDLNVIGSGIGMVPQTATFSTHTQIIASNTHARDAAAQAAKTYGLSVVANLESLHADLPTLAVRVGSQLRSMGKGVLILGGEPTVKLPPAPGRGGRNQALALALAEQIADHPDLVVVVGGTDGSDGPTQDAGGIIDGSTWTENGAQFAMSADSGTYLEAHDALLTTGPTGTNVMDLLVAIRI